MNSAIKAILIDLRRTASCAALATLTTLGTFSLIANVMPPLVADTLVLATSAQTVCAPVTRMIDAARPVKQSTI